jgi:hypothetical protein
VAVRNISTSGAPKGAVAVLSVGAFSIRRDVAALDAGASGAIEFPLQEMDPFALIGVGVTAEVRVESGGVLLDSRTIRLASANPREDLARYFALLARPTGGAFVPPGTDRDQRTRDVTARIVELNESETRDAKSNPWKDAPQTTMAGLVRGELRAAPRDPAVLARFHALGEELWAARKNLGRFLFFNSAKRKAYEAIIREILASSRG